MTAQAAERLTLDGEARAMFATPLDALFQRRGAKPSFLFSCTALWRGYVGDWIVEGDRLWLTGVAGRIASPPGSTRSRPVCFEDLFPAAPSLGLPGEAVDPTGFQANPEYDAAADGAVSVLSQRASKSALAVALEELFTPRPLPRRVRADWYTGVARLPQGEQMRYVHSGFASAYERDLFLTFEKGRLIDRRLVEGHDPLGA